MNYECSICLENIELKDLEILPCNHKFHKECIFIHLIKYSFIFLTIYICCDLLKYADIGKLRIFLEMSVAFGVCFLKDLKILK